MLIFFVVSVQGQFCTQIPGSLSEAEYFLENGEIDSTCFEQFRELLLNPVYPRREGWQRIRELSFEKDGTKFPSIAELTALPDSSAKEMLYKNYPWLLPYDPLFTFEPQLETPIATGLISGQVKTTTLSEQADTRLRAVAHGTRNHLSGELSTITKNQQVTFNRREFAATYPKFSVSLGNMQVSKRSLLWGHFSSSIDETDPLEEILYGNRSTWNGALATVQNDHIQIETMIHQRGSEQLQHGQIVLKHGKLAPQLSLTRQVREEENYLTSLGFSDSLHRFYGETVISQNGGVAITIGGVINSEKVHGELEIWTLSDHYSSEFSSRSYSLNQRYSNPKSSVGMQSQWLWAGILTHYESRFRGEISKSGGRSDLGMTVRWPKIWNSSIHQRFVSDQADTTNEQFVESSIRTSPKQNRFTFPTGSENRFTSNGWNKTVLFTGVNFSGIYFHPDLGLKYRIYRDSEPTFESRFAITHRYKSRGMSSFSLSVPFPDNHNIIISGQVTMLLIE